MSFPLFARAVLLVVIALVTFHQCEYIWCMWLPAGARLGYRCSQMTLVVDGCVERCGDRTHVSVYDGRPG